MKKLTIFILLALAFQAATVKTPFRCNWSAPVAGKPITRLQDLLVIGSRLLPRVSRFVRAFQGFQQGDPSCVNPTSGGTIATTKHLLQRDTNAFTNSAGASGYTGTLNNSGRVQLRIRFRICGYRFSHRSNTLRLRFRRILVSQLARVGCMPDWSGAVSSNVLEVTVTIT